MMFRLICHVHSAALRLSFMSQFWLKANKRKEKEKGVSSGNLFEEESGKNKSEREGNVRLD